MSRASKVVLPGARGRQGAPSRRSRLLAAIMALLWCSTLVVAGSPGAGAAVEPRLTRSPAGGPATTEITISGGRFFPLEAIDVYFDRKDLTLAVADESGAFSRAAIEVPRGAMPGTHWLTLVGRRSGRVARARFTVVPSRWIGWGQEGRDSSRAGHNPNERVLAPDTVGRLRPAWDHYLLSQRTPSLVGRTIVGLEAAGYGDGLAANALDAWTGQPLWRASLAPGEGEFAASEDAVYVHHAGRVTALDVRTGAVRWHRRVGAFRSNPVGSPALAGGVLFTASAWWREGTSHLSALDASGRLLWSRPVDAVAGPAVSGGTVFAPVRGGLTAFDAGSGAVRWTHLAERYLTGTPAVAEGVVYLPAFSGVAGLRLSAHQASDGQTLWATGAPPTGPKYPIGVAVGEGRVYVSWQWFEGHDGGIYAYDAGSGRRIWEVRLAGAPTAPSLANGVVYVASAEGGLQAIDASRGRVLWKGAAADAVGRPVVASGAVYLGSRSSRGYAFRIPGVPRAAAKSLKPRAVLAPDEAGEISAITDLWALAAEGGFGEAANAAPASTVEFGGSLYVGTRLAPGAAGGAEVWRSADGTAFERAARFAGAREVRLEVFEGRMYAAASREDGVELYVTSDGASYTLVGGVPWESGLTRAGLASFGDRLLILASGPRAGSRVYQSPDGRSFTRAATPEGERNGAFALHTMTGGGVSFGEGLYVGVRTPDGGEVWRTEVGWRFVRVAEGGLGRRANRALVPQAVFQGRLYVLAPSPKGLEVFRTSDGATFERVVEAGFGVGPDRNVNGTLQMLGDRLVLATSNRDQRVLEGRRPLEVALARGFQVWSSEDGAAWGQIGADGFGNPHSCEATLLEEGGVLYLAAGNYKEGDSVWRSSDGVSWEPIFREAEATPFSLGPRVVVFDEHLYLLHGDQRLGLSIWRFAEEVAVSEEPPAVVEEAAREGRGGWNWALLGGLLGGALVVAVAAWALSQRARHGPRGPGGRPAPLE